MNVLVTGHEGYIGYILVRLLQKANHRAIGLDNNLFPDCFFGDNSKRCDVRTINKDIRQVELSDLEGVDAICHLAALSNDPISNIDPLLTDEINNTASVKLAKLAKKAGVNRFLFSSTCSVYGSSESKSVNENSDLNTLTPYAKSKADAELEISKLADDNFCPVFFRSATAYGVSPKHRTDLVVNNLVAWAYITDRILIASDGTPWRPLVHAEDIAQAFLCALEAPLEKIHNQAFNVGQTDENYQVKDIAELILQFAPDCRVEYASTHNPDKRSYRVNCDKIFNAMPNYFPKWNLQDGIAELWEAYERNKLTYEQFSGPRYQRILYLRQLLENGTLSPQLYFR